ncbi:MAG: SprT family zinc-dependent metalloprotease [Salinivirgaceae bacterium]
MREQIYTIQDNDAGDIVVEHKRGIKNYNIRLKPFEPVHISAPARASREQVLEIINKKKSWILKKQKENDIITQKRKTLGLNNTIKTMHHQISIQKASINSVRLTGNIPNFIIEIPEHLETEDPEVQSGMKRVLDMVLKYEANQHLPERVFELAHKHKFKFTKLSFRNNKTNWGSCSSKGRISLNIQLMRLPTEMIDYVILHELCHTVHLNHGPAFKNLLYSILPEAPQIEQKMKKYRTQIH